MKQSKLFGKTRKDISRDEKSINAELLTKAGFNKIWKINIAFTTRQSCTYDYRIKNK